MDLYYLNSSPKRKFPNGHHYGQIYNLVSWSEACVQTIIIYGILRIADLYRLPKERCIWAAEQLIDHIMTAFRHLFFQWIFFIYTWRATAIQVKCHSDHSYAATGQPTIMQTVRIHIPCFKIINTINMLSGIRTDAKTIAQCFMIYVLLTYFF